MEPEEQAERTRLIEETWDFHKEWIIKALAEDRIGPHVYAPALPPIVVADYPTYSNQYDMDVADFTTLEFTIHWHPTVMGKMFIIECEGRTVYTGVKLRCV